MVFLSLSSGVSIIGITAANVKALQDGHPLHFRNIPGEIKLQDCILFIGENKVEILHQLQSIGLDVPVEMYQLAALDNT